MAFTAEVVLKNEPLENKHLSVDGFRYVEIRKDGNLSSFDSLKLDNVPLDTEASYRFVGDDDVLVVSGASLLAIMFKKH